MTSPLLTPPGALTPVHALATTGAITADTNMFSGDQLLTGWSFKETTGTATAEVWIIDGGDARGTPVVFVTLNAGESVRDLASPYGIYLRMGAFLHVVSGSVQGAIWAADA